MKKTLILFALICTVSFSYAQLGRFYPINFPKYSFPKGLSQFGFTLFLYKDGNYKIELEREPLSDVIITGYTISIGKYVVKNNSIVLTDSYTGSKMLFQLGSSNLKPVKTFPFMKDIVFKEYYEYYRSSEPSYKMKETTAEKLVKEFEEKNIKNNPFTEGLYRFEYMRGERFDIILHNDKYEFSFKLWENLPFSVKVELDLCLIISTGTWERNGNILMLWDTNLQHKFYGLIREDGIELLFFRWVDDMIFIKR